MPSAAERKTAQALRLLEIVGFPTENRTPKMKARLARIFLALCDLRPGDPWKKAAVWRGKDSWALRSRDIIRFLNKHYGEHISEGSYDDIRRKNLQYLTAAGLVLASPGRPDAQPNDGTRTYAVHPDAAMLLHAFGSSQWKAAVADFIAAHPSLSEILSRPRRQKKFPVKLPRGAIVKLTQGPHNELQLAIIREFLPRFARRADVLYIGDSAKKVVLLKKRVLEGLRFFELGRARLPDIIAYDAKRNWLLLVEAVHTSNPISSLRHHILETAAAECTAGIVYVSVFRDRKSFKAWSDQISWETEVWIADAPEHMIHFNGDRFFGPHKPRRPRRKRMRIR